MIQYLIYIYFMLVDELSREIQLLKNQLKNTTNIHKEEYLKNKIDLLELELENSKTYNNVDHFSIIYNSNDNKTNTIYDFDVLKYKNMSQIKGNKTNFCIYCNSNNLINLLNGGEVCKECGYNITNELYIDKNLLKDNYFENKHTNYIRISYFTKLLNLFQAKETCKIKNEEKILADIKHELLKSDITTYDKLSNLELKKILKKLKYNNYFNHIPYILMKLSNVPPPTLSYHMEQTLKLMFKQMQEPFEMFKTSNRKNLNNIFVIRKLFQLKGLTYYLKYFPNLKSTAKSQEQENIWKKICNFTGWKYIAN